MNNKAIIEGILFLVGNVGIKKNDLTKIINIGLDDVNIIIDDMIHDYENDDRGIMLNCYGDTIKLSTKSIYNEYYKKIIDIDYNDKLTSSSLEVLAIIAYNPNITRFEIDTIRGVNSSYIIRKLLIKGLIEENGRADTIGHPNMYKITDEFLEYLGISGVDELPYVEALKIDDKEKELYDSKYKEE